MDGRGGGNLSISAVMRHSVLVMTQLTPHIAANPSSSLASPPSCIPPALLPRLPPPTPVPTP